MDTLSSLFYFFGFGFGFGLGFIFGFTIGLCGFFGPCGIGTGVNLGSAAVQEMVGAVPAQGVSGLPATQTTIFGNAAVHGVFG